MIVTSNEIFLPVFKAGQALKSSDLNGMINYFERETFDTRIFLEGAGIFYGLELNWNGTNILTITPGVALSSDGYLFAVEQPVGSSTFSLNIVKTETILIGGNSVSGWVFSYGTPGTNPAELKAVVENKENVIVLVMEKETTTTQDCLSNYDNSGNRSTIKFKVVSVQASLLHLSTDTGTGNQQQPDAPFLHRFGYQDSKLISFSGFINWTTVQDNFNKVCSDAEMIIETAYKKLFEQAAGFITLTQTSNPFNNLARDLGVIRMVITSNKSNIYWLPYYYDHLRNLVSAWHEVIASGAGHLFAFPDRNRFPGYVVLGNIQKGFRTKLTRPPFADADSQTQEILQKLIERMEALAEKNATQFSAQQMPDTVKVTPGGRLSQQLSQRAIHFYYTQIDTLQKVWDPESIRRPRLYPVTGVNPDDDHELLLQEMDAFGFYHIYGHVGSVADKAIADIKQQRKDLHLPFDIKLVYLETDLAETKLRDEFAISFSDLGLLLLKIVSDLVCIRDCGPQLLDKIFKTSLSNPWDDAARLQDLAVFFKEADKPGTEKWNEFVNKYCLNKCEDFNDCCPVLLQELYNISVEYNSRKDELLAGLLFSSFAQAHPGLEHNAGVPPGGTLVLLIDRLPLPGSDAKIVEKVAKLFNHEKDLAMQMAAANQDEIIVADFSLPYTCCSKKPSLNIEFKPVLPTADFQEADRVPEPKFDKVNQTIKGYRLNLLNNSHNATEFHWQLFDINSVPMGTETITHSVNDPVSYVLDFAAGTSFWIKLTARRGTLSDSVFHKFNLCPLSDELTLDLKGQKEFTWTIGDPDIILSASPFGGLFLWNDEEPPQGFLQWKPDHQSIILHVQKFNPEPGIYILSYGIASCTRVKFTLTVQRPKGDSSQTVTPKDVFNKRLLAYRKSLEQIGKDAAVVKLKRYDSTNNFFLTPSPSKPDKALQNFDTAYSTLLTAFNDPKEKITDAQTEPVAQLLMNATAFYLDKLVALSPQAASANSGESVKAGIELLKSLQQKPDALLEKWKPADIQSDQNRDTIKAYQELFV